MQPENNQEPFSGHATKMNHRKQEQRRHGTCQKAYDLLHDDSDVFLPLEAIRHLTLYHTWDGCSNYGPVDAHFESEAVEGG